MKPSAFAITVGLPHYIKETQLLVVPKSIPTTLPMGKFLIFAILHNRSSSSLLLLKDGVWFPNRSVFLRKKF